MNEQTTGKLSEGELEAIKARDKEAAELIPEHVVLTRVDPDYRAECYCDLDRRALLSHIDYQDAKIERLKQRLLTAAGDDLCRLIQEEIKDLTGGKVPIPPKDEFLASCERFHSQIAAESGVNHNCLTLAQLVAEIERLTKQLAAATAKLDSLKVDPAKRQELGERAADIFDHAFKTPEYLAKGGGEWISCQPQRREAWIRVAEFFFAAGRASAPEVAELGKVLDAEAADHSVDAAEKVEPPASEEQRFVCPICGRAVVPTIDSLLICSCGWRSELTLKAKKPQAFSCPKCGCTKKYDSHPPSKDVSCASDVCDWAGTWAEVEAAKSARMAEMTQSGIERNQAEARAEREAEVEVAKGEQSQSLECRIRKAYRRLDDPLFESAMDDLLGLECQLADARRECADCEESNEEIFKRFNRVCDQRNGYSEEVKLLKQQLAAERQAREASDRQATEKILELERRCNAEHHKCEAAEKRAEHAEAAKQDEVYLRGNQLAAISTVLTANTPVTLSQVRLPKDHSLYTAAFQDAVNAVEREIKERQRAHRAEATLKQMCDLDEETSRLERESCDARTEGIRAAMDGVKREDCPHKDEPKQTSWLRGHEETESMMELQRRAEQAEAESSLQVKSIKDAIDLHKAADDERLKEQEEAHREAAKWKAEDDMYGWNFHEGRAGGMNAASIIFCRVRRFLDKALATDAGRAAADELRALRTFRAEIEQDYQAWANATIGEAELRIRLGVARNKVDKAIAGQGGTGKEGR